MPPPIVPEDDSASSPVSETSSGYVSNSISMATLSDVYTLSWDLPPPPPPGRRSDGFEAPPDTEEESPAGDPRPFGQESLLVWDEGADPVPRGPDGAAPESRPGGQEAPEDEPDAKASLPGAEQEPRTQGAVTHPRREQATFRGAPDPPRQQVPALVLAPAPSGEHQDVAELQPTPELPSSGRIGPSPPARGEAPAEASKAPAAPDLVPSGANPFKIQRVKSSDLKSFQPILGTAAVAAAAPVDHAGSLAVPPDGLEIISDSEEGDAAAAVLPDWLRDGELVTVGGNKSGTVRYVGPADFAKGTWVGVELEVPAGE